MRTFLSRCGIAVALAGLAAPSLLACFCIEGAVCDTFADAKAVFIGKVVSLDPSFDIRDPEVHHSLDALIDHPSIQALADFKRRYANGFPEPVRTDVNRAHNGAELQAALSELAEKNWEKRVTFLVQQGYKGLSHDVKMIDVQTSFTDCGVSVIAGETYVVYASSGKNGLTIGACSRTRRLSEAGDDLVYLHFMENGGQDAGRIWGLLSHDRREARKPHVGDEAMAPASGLNVQLRSSRATLRQWTKQDGRFVFDGLPAGDYENRCDDVSEHVASPDRDPQSPSAAESLQERMVLRSERQGFEVKVLLTCVRKSANAARMSVCATHQSQIPICLASAAAPSSTTAHR